MTRKLPVVTVIVGALFLLQDVGHAQRATTLHLQPGTAEDLRTWDAYVTRHERSGELAITSVEHDPAFATRTVERLQQLHNGVPVWGASVVRDTDSGVALSMFGALASDIDIPTSPSLRTADIQGRLVENAGVSVLREPALVVLPTESGDYRLAYTAVIASEGAVDRVFVDAHDGRELLRYSEIQTQAAIGTGKGVHGDTKKVSAVRESGAFWADDQLRPPVLKTFDMRGNVLRARDVVERGASLSAAERAADTDNEWGDAVAVDAHAHVGWTYDYYFKRLGRRGLDDRDRAIVALINVLTRQSGAAYFGTSLRAYVDNAFWCSECGPSGIMVLGNGFADGLYDSSSGQNTGYLAGALDVVAHELTHGVIDSSSRLEYRNESGALNEAFADMMGTSVEFYFQSPGTGLRQADYLIAEDAVRGVATSLHGFRSMSNPALFKQPDHYARRVITSADNGGVHTNSGIPNHAFYLAIEGGTNRTSGLSVQGVGAANREHIERVFYRAFVFLLPSNARFSTARAATIQAARDLYGVGSPAERAVTEAWTAVGVL